MQKIPWDYPPNCDILLSGQANSSQIKEAKEWKDKRTDDLKSQIEDAASNPDDSCGIIKNNFLFIEKPLSKEEEDYPLAYGMIVYKDIVQVYKTISSFYHPQNAYCVAIDGKSDKAYKAQVQLLNKCFPNIIVYDVMASIEWCSPNVANALFDCFEILTYSNHPWNYYQYITAFDAPLKTNLEMTRILKQLNDAVITEVTVGGTIQTNRNNKDSSKLSVWKAGMSAVVSRKAANDLLNIQANRLIVHQLMESMGYDNYDVCPDELIWATFFGNSNIMNLTGSFDAAEYHRKHINLKYEFSMRRQRNKLRIENVEPFVPLSPHIGRYQVWEKRNCNGQMYRGSCVFGVEDLPVLAIRAELVAHKFYSSYEPAASSCIQQLIRKRARSQSQQLFRGENYKTLPLVELRNGRSIQDQFYSFIHKKRKS